MTTRVFFKKSIEIRYLDFAFVAIKGQGTPLRAHTALIGRGYPKNVTKIRNLFFNTMVCSSKE